MITLPPLDDEGVARIQAETGASADNIPVVLKVTLVDYSVPGTYPLVKSKERTTPGKPIQPPQFEIGTQRDFLIVLVR